MLLFIILNFSLISAATEVCTREDLNNVRNDLNGDYIQVCYINLTGYSLSPVGSLLSPFTGIYDGNGYEISNFFISSSPGSDAGLFGVIDGNSILKNNRHIACRITSGNCRFIIAGLFWHCDSDLIQRILFAGSTARQSACLPSTLISISFHRMFSLIIPCRPTASGINFINYTTFFVKQPQPHTIII